MSQRALLALLAALAVLAVLVVWSQRASTPPSAEGGKILPDLQAALNDIDKVTVVKGGGTVVATLDRQPDKWTVMERGGYPADVGKLRKNLLALAEARILEQKTSNPDNYDRLGVQDIDNKTAKGVAISFAAANRKLPTLIIGNAEGTKYRYVRRAGEAPSFLIDRDPDLPHDTAQWLDPIIVDVQPNRVQQVTIHHSDGETLIVEKADRAATNFTVQDVPKGRELLYPGVANVIGNSLRQLNLSDVEPLGQAAGEPAVTVEFRTFDGLVIKVDGFKTDDKNWLTFNAAFDADQAKRFAPPPAKATDQAKTAEQAKPAEAAASADGSATDEKPASAASAEKPSTPSPDVAAEAADINRRVSNWRYQIASYQYDQMTRRMTDLLKPKEEPKKAQDQAKNPAATKKK
jgi:hypothetical protein